MEMSGRALQFDDRGGCRIVSKDEKRGFKMTNKCFLSSKDSAHNAGVFEKS